MSGHPDGLSRDTMISGTQMPVPVGSLLARITVDTDVRFGKPCIRGNRITVQEVLGWLLTGASQQQILADYPQLEADDFLLFTPTPRNSWGQSLGRLKLLFGESLSPKLVLLLRPVP